MKLYLDPAKLDRAAQEHGNEYRTAEPYPHTVIDGLFPEEALDRVIADYPSIESPAWKEYRNYHEGKRETQGEGQVSEFTSLLLYQFNSAPFLQFLEKLTGIENLIPDPYFYGGGLHQITRGGKLGIHADFSKHGKLPLDRRINAIIYLNKDWKDEYGGHFELWDREMTRCVKKVAPLYNRLVVFNVTDYAYHGHPDPLTCPENRTRKSIALFYFTNGRPEEEVMPGKTSTLFMKRPGEDLPEGTILHRDASYTGLVEKPSSSPNPNPLKHWVKQLTPPILISAAKSLRGKE
jgi:2OG-Fe(II) oxygenase superfamily